MNNINSNNLRLLKFMNLINHRKIEDAITEFMKPDFMIHYNKKTRIVKKSIWIKHLKNTLLNTHTEILQFNVSDIESFNNNLKFKIHMICKSLNGDLFFTEVNMKNEWKNNLIYSTNYKIVNH